MGMGAWLNRSVAAGANIPGAGRRAPRCMPIRREKDSLIVFFLTGWAYPDSGVCLPLGLRERTGGCLPCQKRAGFVFPAGRISLPVCMGNQSIGFEPLSDWHASAADFQEIRMVPGRSAFIPHHRSIRLVIIFFPQARGFGARFSGPALPHAFPHRGEGISGEGAET